MSELKLEAEMDQKALEEAADALLKEAEAQEKEQKKGKNGEEKHACAGYAGFSDAFSHTDSHAHAV